MSWLLHRLTYANVMSTIAVFLCLGGVAWAATLPANSVGRTQLKKNAVTGAKVKNGSLTSADFKAGAVPAGAQGPAGPTGPSGTGPAYVGARDGSSLLSVFSSFLTVVSTPTLPAGSYVVTGRANVIGGGGVTNVLICSMLEDVAQNFTVANGGVVPLTLHSTTTLTAPGTVSLACSKSAGSPDIAQASIVATRVTAINPS